MTIKRFFKKYFWGIVSLLLVSSAAYIFMTARPDAPSQLVITEFLAGNNIGPIDEDGDYSDWIEIHNRSDKAVNLSGWYLTDDSNRPEKWSFPVKTLNSGEYLIVFASGKDRIGEPLHTNFKLSKTDNFLGLYNVLDGKFKDKIELQSFGYFRNISYGSRDGEYGYFTEPTPGRANLNRQIDPGINASVALFAEDPEISERGSTVQNSANANKQIQLSELMYNPRDGNEYEFIELKNVSSKPFDISGAFFIEGIEFTFRYSPPLEPGEVVVLANDAKAFAERYPGVRLDGIYDGNLSNRGERILLNDLRGNVLVSVTYDDENGWPLSADGAGDSLVYVATDENVTNPKNWRASQQLYGSPGQDTNPAHDQLVQVQLENIGQRLYNFLSNYGILSSIIKG